MVIRQFILITRVLGNFRNHGPCFRSKNKTGHGIRYSHSRSLDKSLCREDHHNNCNDFADRSASLHRLRYFRQTRSKLRSAAHARMPQRGPRFDTHQLQSTLSDSTYRNNRYPREMR